MPGMNKKTKSFWERPEGTTGMIFAAGALLAGGWGLYVALPFLIALASNLLYLGLMIMGCAVVFTVLLDKRLRNLVFYIYKSVMRAITGVFIEIDPIGILKTYIGDLNKKKAELDEQIDTLAGTKRNLKRVIDDNERKRATLIGQMKQAEKQGLTEELTFNGRKASRLEESNKSLTNLHKTLEAMFGFLAKTSKATHYMIEDLKDEVDVKTRERKVITASHSAFKSAMKIIRGDQDQRDMFDAALEHMADDYGNKLGEIERYIETSTSFINDIDITNGLHEANAMKMLEDLEASAPSFIEVVPSKKYVR